MFTLFGFCLVVIGAVFVLQTAWAKEKAKEILIRELAAAGLALEMTSLEGSLPYEVRIKNLSLQTRSGILVEIDSVKLRLSLIYLLKNELRFKSIVGDGVRFTLPGSFTPTLAEETVESASFAYAISVQRFSFSHVDEVGDVEGRFWISENKKIFLSMDSDLLRLVFGGRQDKQGDWKGITKGQWKPRALPSFPEPIRGFLERRWTFSIRYATENGALHLTNLTARNAFLKMKGKATFIDGNFSTGSLLLSSKTLVTTIPVDLAGKISARMALQRDDEGLHGEIEWDTPALEVDSFSIKKVHGIARGVWNPGALDMGVFASGLYAEEVFSANSKFSWKSGVSLQCTDLSLRATGVEANGSLEIFPDMLYVGQGEAKVQNLQLLPFLGLYGTLSLETTASLTPERIQHLFIDAVAEKLHYGPVRASAACIHVERLGSTVNGSADLADVTYRQLYLDSVDIAISDVGKQGSFAIGAFGDWGKPLRFSFDGSWRKEEGAFYALIERGQGSFFTHPFSLQKAVSIEVGEARAKVSDTTLLFDSATIAASLNYSQKNTEATLKVTALPLDFLSLNPLDVSVQGAVNLEGEWKGQQGSLNGSFSGLRITTLDADPLRGEGEFALRYLKSRLDGNASFRMNGAPLVSAEATIPVYINPWPFEFDLYEENQVQSHLAFHGRMEYFFDFFNMGVHYFQGLCNCDLSLEGTLGMPYLTGSLRWSDGFYENYLSGTELHNVQATVQAEGRRIDLVTLTAQDSLKEGALIATGTMALNLDEKFPFTLDLTMSRFLFSQIDLITATGKGTLRIEGTLAQALAKGSLTVIEGEIFIPDRFPRSIPSLPVTYRHAQKPMAQPQRSPSYPLALDLRVTAPSKISISGHGLTSEWKGNFDLKGTLSEPAPEGTLELVQGTYVFSGREFTLTEGTLVFNGKANVPPTLTLVGTTEKSGVTIIATLQGPLDHPQLTFRSSPPLPLSSILSYVLFGHDLAEMTAKQALQIANSVASLSDPADLLATTRRSLGVDRFEVLTSPSGGDEEADAVALQAGIYVAKGVTVSFSQGAEDSGANISVDVDLSRGFIFEVQTLQDQEQGKFTLKWNLNY